MFSTLCFTLDDEEDLELDDEPFLCDRDKATILRNDKKGPGDPQMPISIIEQSRTAESKTENKSERPGRRPLKGIQQIEGSLYWNHLPAKKSCRSDIRPLTNMISSNSEYNKVSSVESTQQHCSQLVDEPRRKSLRDSNSLIHGGHTQYTKTTGCKTVEDSVLLERKFPGPAGILPKKCEHADLTRIQGDEKKSRQTSKTQALPISTPVDDADFKSSSWLAMCEQLQTPSTAAPSELNSIPWSVDYTVAYALKQAMSCCLPYGKVPHLRVFVKSLTQSGSQANVVLKDPTGEIMGVVHGQVLEHYKSSLSNAATIILKQVRRVPFSW